MTNPKRSGRLTTLDLLRGFFLFVIIVDHVELFPSIFDLLTGKGRLWVSAAEGFFFISGLLVGYIYRRKLAQGMRYIWAKTWKRAGVLYFWSVGLTLLFTLWAVSMGGQFIKFGLPAQIDWPTIIWSTMTLHYTYGWADFLSHYVVFMLAAPLVIFLLSKNKWWLVVAASVALWLARGQSFKLAWQLLFVGGMILGYYWTPLQAVIQAWPARRKMLASRFIIGTAVATFLLSYSSIYVLGGLNDNQAALPIWASNMVDVWDNWNTFVWHFFEKWTLEPGRILLFALWFVAMYLMVDRYAERLPARVRGWFILLGTNSLFVYGAHSIVVFALHCLVTQWVGIWFNFVVTAIVLAIISALTWLKVAINREPAAAGMRAKRSIARMVSTTDTPT